MNVSNLMGLYMGEAHTGGGGLVIGGLQYLIILYSQYTNTELTLPCFLHLYKYLYTNNKLGVRSLIKKQIDILFILISDIIIVLNTTEKCNVI